MNVTEGFEGFIEQRIKVKKDEAGASTFNQLYDKSQVDQYKFVKKKLLDIVWNVHGRINWSNLIMIFSTVI